MKKSGYTLIEVLGVITILGIIMLIAVPSVTGTLKKQQNREYDRFLSDVYMGTEAYVEKNIDKYPELNNIDGQVYIYMKELIESKFLKSSLYNPKKKQTVKDELDYTIVVTLKEEKLYEYKLYEEKLLSEYIVFENGTAVYFNPETGKRCSEYETTKSNTGVKTGCMKWYTYNDDKKNSTVKMILDHNTTAVVAYNSTGTNTSMKELATSLTNDTSTWQGSLNPSIITANEVAKITGNTTFNQATTTLANFFYFDSNTSVASNTCKTGNITGCKYGWLYDRTNLACITLGCSNNSDVSLNGYFTSSSIVGISTGAWCIDRNSILGHCNVADINYGLRPVITVSKSSLNSCNIASGTEYKYDYTGSAQEFIAACNGVYKVELWGAQGGNVGPHFGGKGAYTLGTINIDSSKKVYIYVGGVGSNTDIGGYNGGQNLTNGQSVFGASGGGASDIRLVSGTWSNAGSLRSRIMVTAGGGGANYRNASHSDNLNYGEGDGGAGGKLIGLSGESINYKADSLYGTYNMHHYGSGGTQISGGMRKRYNSVDELILEEVTGTFGNGVSLMLNQSGGGSGYYGGGYGNHGGGGGGSSFISGHPGCIAIKSETDQTPKVTTYSKIEDSYHYSGKVFTNTLMKAGNESMPNPRGAGNITGNNGNGYARITYLG